MFEVGGIGGQVGPIKSNEDSLAIDGVLGEKLTVSILELADLRWIEDANFAVGPIESPLVGLRIVHAQGQAFDVAGWTADFDLVNTGAIVNLAADTGAVKFDPGVGTSQGIQAPLEVILP